MCCETGHEPASSKWALRHLGLLHVLGHIMLEGCANGYTMQLTRLHFSCHSSCRQQFKTFLNDGMFVRKNVSSETRGNMSMCKLWAISRVLKLGILILPSNEHLRVPPVECQTLAHEDNTTFGVVAFWCKS